MYSTGLNNVVPARRKLHVHNEGAELFAADTLYGYSRNIAKLSCLTITMIINNPKLPKIMRQEEYYTPPPRVMWYKDHDNNHCHVVSEIQKEF